MSVLLWTGVGYLEGMLPRLILVWTVIMILFTLYVYLDMMHKHDQMLGVIGALFLYFIGLPVIYIIWVIFLKKR